MAAYPSWKTRQMSAMRSRVEIGNHWRAHRMVLRALSESKPPEVKPKVLLTGRPGCGKTTLIKRVVNELALPAGGFYTEEIREHGQRFGFKIITLDGKEAVFAHVDFKTPERRWTYVLSLSVLECVAV